MKSGEMHGKENSKMCLSVCANCHAFKFNKI